MRRVWLHEGRGASHLLPERKRTPIGSRSKGRVARRAGKAPGGHAEANATLAAQAGVAWKVGSAMALAVTNRVAQKLALVPMEGHILFLSLLVSCGYVAVYGGVLSYKVARGDVPLSDLRMLPFRLFLLVGLGEACGSALSSAPTPPAWHCRAQAEEGLSKGCPCPQAVWGVRVARCGPPAPEPDGGGVADGVVQGPPRQAVPPAQFRRRPPRHLRRPGSHKPWRRRWPGAPLG